MRRLSVLLVALLSLVVLAGCGGANGDDSRPDEDATLTLDFTPNAVHTGIEYAVQRGYDEAEGVTLKVVSPSQTSDAVTLLTTGRTQFAVMDLHDLAIADTDPAHPKDIVAVMAIVQRPLASVIAQPSISSPRQLDGERVGVTGAPSDDAVLDSIVSGAGGKPASLKRATIGFDAVRALLAGKVQAATAFWNDEGVQVQEARPKSKVFRLDDFGAPSYPELVLAVTRDRLDDDPDLVSATVHALQRGYQQALLDPDSGVEAVLQAAPGAKRAETAAELSAVSPAFQAQDGSIGTFDMAGLQRWATWEQRVGIVARRPDVTQMFDPSFARSGLKRLKQDPGS